MGRRRGGLTTKIHAVVDQRGLPIRLGLTPSQAHDTSLVAELLGGIGEDTVVVGDKAFDAENDRAMLKLAAIRVWLRYYESMAYPPR